MKLQTYIEKHGDHSFSFSIIYTNELIVQVNKIKSFREAEKQMNYYLQDLIDTIKESGWDM